ncbi:D-beta-hydroxybutyrate dehydrogenase, mitochondrial-like isoform X3 [Corvus cornix cornix]|uniref:D-beta-hydroxybutyrate dehydrogenase, mitochondrial-like isoform X3 n=1 Tax=Corvus cornix cornix TaxID=932674 RepID=UPI000816601F|nr:D-beta-hydroxybutyrate dehydrogenase, mitochondrial-like isoform X3 [Corvus cornix cornix]XP_017600746.1 PREDICTED: D-beta-hydroxybutyrate dehydrogenase, mitochondrial isoform X1 [Corvus brachyrhynchos]XP_048153118.1 D-beta-hydroxybutyrate dehydrogenase, mitochondrial-like isoform X2 [Corvus hawaiiensis]
MKGHQTHMGYVREKPPVRGRRLSRLHAGTAYCSSLLHSPLSPTELCPDSPEEKPTAACASAEVQKLTGFWGLVNNAGISTFGETGWLPMETYEKFADVNLLGSIRTTLAFLPLLRKYKGRIVFMSSIIAYFTLGNGIYSMTKAAIEKFCDALRLEMKKFGVQVCIIQPGNYAPSTKIQPPVSAEQIWSELSEEEKAVYNKEYVEERANFFNRILSEGSTNGNEVVDAMVDALTSPAPKARYMVAKLKEKALVFVCALFPTVVMDSVLSYALSKVKLA